MKSPVISAVVERHAEEAAFLWSQRGLAIGLPHYSLPQLTELEKRLEAHIDGLRVAGDAGWDICLKALEGGGAGEVFAAAVLAFESGDGGRIQDVLAAVASKPEAVRGVISALGWLTYEVASKHIRTLVSDASTVLRHVGIAASAIHRRNPGHVLTDAFVSEDPLLKARALRAAGELGLVDYHMTLRANLAREKDPSCRFWAACSDVLLKGCKEAVTHLQQVAEAGGPFAERAAAMAIRRLAPHDARIWVKRLFRELGQKRIAVIAAGAFADPAVIPFLIESMKVPALARVAGESFSLITGARMDRDGLVGRKPEGVEVGPSDHPADEDVAMDSDENLAWPDPALVQKWWEARRAGFSTGTRYLLGQEITIESIRRALKIGYQRQRAAAAIELAILKPGRPLFEVRAPGSRQQSVL